jgi:hypothetical protein
VPSGQISGFSSHHPALSRGAYRDRHETWGGDAVDVEVPLTSGAEADGEIVWSWRRDAGVKLAGRDLQATVAKEPVHRGEREDKPLKPSRRECRTSSVDACLDK